MKFCVRLVACFGHFSLADRHAQRLQFKAALERDRRTTWKTYCLSWSAGHSKCE